MKYYVQTKYDIVRSTVLYLCVFAVIGLIESIGLLRPLQASMLGMLAPVSKITSSVVSSVYWQVGVWQQMRLSSIRVTELERENAVLQAQLSQLETVKKENDSLKVLMGARTDAVAKKSTVATITNYALPTIDIGSDQNVKEGQLVMSQDTLLGIVTKVYEQQSEVEILSALHSKSLLVKTESGIQGILHGDNKRIVITDIPRDVEIKVGERVSTYGQQDVPANIFIGTVASKIDRPTAPVQSAIVSQPLTFFDSTVVEIE